MESRLHAEIEPLRLGSRLHAEIEPVRLGSRPHAEAEPLPSVTLAEAGRAGARATTGGTSTPWLLSPAIDFWLVCAGGGALLLLIALALVWHGNRELAMADLLLAELHLGATYDAIARRRLWRRMPVTVFVVPLAIVAATYAVSLQGHPVLVVTAIVYVGAWHRGRQSLGIARHYQRQVGGPVSAWHRRLFSAAVYLPMIAALAYFTATSPVWEGEEYLAYPLAPGLVWTLAALAGASLALYLGWTTGRTGLAVASGASTVHPAERWLVVANAVAFGSAYVIGAWTEGFLLVMVIHHEIQYLAFTFGIARRHAPAGIGRLARNVRLLLSFSLWPLVGIGSWALCQGWDPPEALLPFLSAGLLAHYWLDGRIWTRRARNLSPQ